MKTNKLLAISMMALAALSFSACDGNTEVTDPTKNSLETAMETTRGQFVEKTVLPTYRGLADACAVLNEKLEGFTSASSDADLKAICDEWIVARQYWEWSEAFLFGPATTYSIDPHIDTWPFNETTFNNLLSKYHPATNELDAEVIDEAISFTQNLTGFHALEYLIFRNGTQRKVSDLTEDEIYFAKSVTADLRLAAIKLVSAWGGEISDDEQAILDDAEWEAERNYGEYFKSETGTDAAVAIIEGARDIIGEVNEMKIGAPHTGADTKYIESPHAYNSIQDFYDNILSCQHALYGALNATAPLEGSLIANTQANSLLKDQTAKVVEALNNSLAKIKAMKAPFVTFYEDASAGEAMEALGVLDDELKSLEDLIQNYDEK